MDRRQKKTREAVFRAFTELLSVKHYNQITVQEIIDAADIGRSTFYAHFETKDQLLEEMCDDLSTHMIETAHGHYTDEHRRTGASIFLHLLIHIRENNRNIASLISSPSNEVFMHYFKQNLNRMIQTQYADAGLIQSRGLPEDYLVNHISTTFVATVYWWIRRKMQEPPETVEAYFRTALAGLVDFRPAGE